MKEDKESMVIVVPWDFTVSSRVFSLSLLVYCGQWNSYFLLHIVNAVNQSLGYNARCSIDNFRLPFGSPSL